MREDMLKIVTWKPYLIFAIIASLIAVIIKLEIGVGFVIGTVFNFINLFLIDKKFPSLDSKKKTISIALIIMLFQGLVTVVMAISTYFIGGLPCFFAGFAGMIIPHFYFVFKSFIK